MSKRAKIEKVHGQPYDPQALRAEGTLLAQVRERLAEIDFGSDWAMRHEMAVRLRQTGVILLRQRHTGKKIYRNMLLTASKWTLDEVREKLEEPW